MAQWWKVMRMMINALEGFEETMQDEGGWVDIYINSIDTPPLAIKSIHKFFIQQWLHKEQVTASKAFKWGYLFYAKKVQAYHILHQVSSDSLYCIMSNNSWSLQDSHCHLQYHRWRIYYAGCNCIAGRSSSCNNTAALISTGTNPKEKILAVHPDLEKNYKGTL